MGSIRLQWNANPSKERVTKYVIERRHLESFKDGPPGVKERLDSLLQRLKSNPWEYGVWGGYIRIAVVDTTEHIDDGRIQRSRWPERYLVPKLLQHHSIEEHPAYQYRIRAVNSSGKGLWKEELVVIPPDVTENNKPEIIKIKGGQDVAPDDKEVPVQGKRFTGSSAVIITPDKDKIKLQPFSWNVKSDTLGYIRDFRNSLGRHVQEGTYSLVVTNEFGDSDPFPFTVKGGTQQPGQEGAGQPGQGGQTHTAQDPDVVDGEFTDNTNAGGNQQETPQIEYKPDEGVAPEGTPTQKVGGPPQTEDSSDKDNSQSGGQDNGHPNDVDQLSRTSEEDWSVKIIVPRNGAELDPENKKHHRLKAEIIASKQKKTEIIQKGIVYDWIVQRPDSKDQVNQRGWQWRGSFDMPRGLEDKLAKSGYGERITITVVASPAGHENFEDQSEEALRRRDTITVKVKSGDLKVSLPTRSVQELLPLRDDLIQQFTIYFADGTYNKLLESIPGIINKLDKAYEVLKDAAQFTQVEQDTEREQGIVSLRQDIESLKSVVLEENLKGVHDKMFNFVYDTDNQTSDYQWLDRKKGEKAPPNVFPVLQDSNEAAKLASNVQRAIRKNLSALVDKIVRYNELLSHVQRSIRES